MGQGIQPVRVKSQLELGVDDDVASSYSNDTNIPPLLSLCYEHFNEAHCCLLCKAS